MKHIPSILVLAFGLILGNWIITRSAVREIDHIYFKLDFPSGVMMQNTLEMGQFITDTQAAQTLDTGLLLTVDQAFALVEDVHEVILTKGPVFAEIDQYDKSLVLEPLKEDDKLIHIQPEKSATLFTPSDRIKFRKLSAEVARITLGNLLSIFTAEEKKR